MKTIRFLLAGVAILAASRLMPSPYAVAARASPSAAKVEKIPGPDFQPASYFANQRATFQKDKTAHPEKYVEAADKQPEWFFTGKPYDADSKSYLFKYRNYRPDSASWMQPDPAGFPDGANNYAYAPVPTHAVDPTGLAEVDLYNHNAFLWFKHSFLVVYPDYDDEVVMADLGLNSIEDLPYDGSDYYFTIGARSSAGFSGAGSSGVGGNLVDSFNYTTESLGNTNYTQNLIEVISTCSEDVDAVADAGYNYWGGDVLHYSPSTLNGYNSNSFTAGLLGFAVGYVPSEGYVGWSSPVPGMYFAPTE